MLRDLPAISPLSQRIESNELEKHKATRSLDLALRPRSSRHRVSTLPECWNSGIRGTHTLFRKKQRSLLIHKNQRPVLFPAFGFLKRGMCPSIPMSPGVANLSEILELSTEATGEADLVDALRADFAAGTLMYSKLKDTVFEQLMEVLHPIQQRRAELEASGEVLDCFVSAQRTPKR